MVSRARWEIVEMMAGYWQFAWAFALCVVGVGLALVYSRWAGVVDVPNQRSSHTQPTPRGGGIALVVSVMVVSSFALIPADTESRLTFAVLGAALILLTVVGWVDDHRSMPIIRRLPFHLVCGLAMAFAVNEFAPLPGPVNVLWLAWWVFWTAASINIVNFMDGIDGMVAAQGFIYGLFLFALVPATQMGAQFGLVLAGACLGFLIWNWAPARMFMGDVGSGPLGLLLVIGGALALHAGAPAALVFVPLFPLFFDALATIVLRHRAGESILTPHRVHLYQRVANSGVGHARVSTSYAVAAAIGALVALSVKDAAPARVALAIAIYCAAVVAVWLVVHGRTGGAPGRSTA